ncbi:unnamed protein product [Allacma fusca]|uniref:Uncharacterized protein n=1 Tax=Allacma fusca TaxID=39272 RepID=A0A8J2K1J0_9HEXA|nr:unnamed protein product [Allacma fusca]
MAFLLISALIVIQSYHLSAGNLVPQTALKFSGASELIFGNVLSSPTGSNRVDRAIADSSYNSATYQPTKCEIIKIDHRKLKRCEYSDGTATFKEMPIKKKSKKN